MVHRIKLNLYDSHISRSSRLSLSLRLWVYHPMTRAHVRLLGPCFKTGRIGGRLSDVADV